MGVLAKRSVALSTNRLDFNGLAAVAKLIEMRVDNDIKKMQQLLDGENAKMPKGGDIHPILGRASEALIKRKIESLTKTLLAKRSWLSKWKEIVWNGLADAGANVASLKQKTVEEIFSEYYGENERVFQRFLILQEAVLAPIYGDFPGLPKGLSEDDSASQCELVASLAGFPRALGLRVYNDTCSFVRDAQGFWGKVVKYALVGGVVLAVIALIAAGPIAGAIGAAGGLQGGAAVTAGLAALGGGSMAAGGLGMAGGLALLVGGGALLGSAAGGVGIAKHLSNISRETTVLALAKMTNYAVYLKSVSGGSSENARKALRALNGEFLQMKHELERELLNDDAQVDDKKAVLENVRLFSFTYDRLVEKTV